MINISDDTEEYYSKILKEADEEWRKLSDEDKKRYNILAKEFEQTGQDYFLFKKIAEKNKEEEKKCTH